jgi:hypothetical protein
MPDERADSAHAIARLERRLRRLESLSRLLGAGLALSLLLVLGAFFSPRSPESDVVRARRLQVVDETGRVRIDLRHDSTETGLFVLDDAGNPRVGAAQFAHGGGGFALHGPGLKGAAVLYLKGAGTLSFYDSSGAVTARFPEPTER